MNRLIGVPSVPVAVLETPVNPTAQTVVTTMWFAMCALVLVLLIRDYRRHRSWVPTFMILGCALGLFIEPFWDYVFQLVHYVPGQWTTWTAFGVPQPLWITACYLSGFAAYPLLLFRKVVNGDSRASFVPLVISSLIVYELVEVVMTGIGLYEYWGAHPLRIWKFPAYVSFGNWGGILLTAVGAAIVEMHVRSPIARAVAATLMFPFCFIGVTFMTQLPILIVLSRQTEVTVLSYVAAFLTMTLGCTLVWLIVRALPLRFGATT